MAYLKRITNTNVRLIIVCTHYLLAAGNVFLIYILIQVGRPFLFSSVKKKTHGTETAVLRERDTSKP